MEAKPISVAHVIALTTVDTGCATPRLLESSHVENGNENRGSEKPPGSPSEGPLGFFSFFCFWFCAMRRAARGGSAGHMLSRADSKCPRVSLSAPLIFQIDAEIEGQSGHELGVDDVIDLGKEHVDESLSREG